MNKLKLFKWLDVMLICCYAALMGLFSGHIIERDLLAQDQEWITQTNNSTVNIGITNEALGRIDLSGAVWGVSGVLTNKAKVWNGTNGINSGDYIEVDGSLVTSNSGSPLILALTNQAYIKIGNRTLINLSSNEWIVLTNHYRKFLEYHDINFYDTW